MIITASYLIVGMCVNVCVCIKEIALFSPSFLVAVLCTVHVNDPCVVLCVA